jgi:hypothetical protein
MIMYRSSIATGSAFIEHRAALAICKSRGMNKFTTEYSYLVDPGSLQAGAYYLSLGGSNHANGGQRDERLVELYYFLTWPADRKICQRSGNGTQATSSAATAPRANPPPLPGPDAEPDCMEGPRKGSDTSREQAG